jgi:hypothetical protein
MADVGLLLLQMMASLLSYGCSRLHQPYGMPSSCVFGWHGNGCKCAAAGQPDEAGGHPAAGCSLLHPAHTFAAALLAYWYTRSVCLSLVLSFLSFS